MCVVSGHAHPVLILGVKLARNGKVTEDLGDRKDGRGHAGRRRNDDRSPRQVQQHGGPRFAPWSGGVSNRRKEIGRSGPPPSRHRRICKPLEVELEAHKEAFASVEQLKDVIRALGRNRGKQDARHRRSGQIERLGPELVFEHLEQMPHVVEEHSGKTFQVHLMNFAQAGDRVRDASKRLQQLPRRAFILRFRNQAREAVYAIGVHERLDQVHSQPIEAIQPVRNRRHHDFRRALQLAHHREQLDHAPRRRQSERPDRPHRSLQPLNRDARRSVGSEAASSNASPHVVSRCWNALPQWGHCDPRAQWRGVAIQSEQATYRRQAQCGGHRVSDGPARPSQRNDVAERAEDPERVVRCAGSSRERQLLPDQRKQDPFDRGRRARNIIERLP